MEETDMIIDRCKSILEGLDKNEVDKDIVKLQLQAMGTIINARKTDFVIETTKFNLLQRERFIEQNKIELHN